MKKRSKLILIPASSIFLLLSCPPTFSDQSIDASINQIRNVFGSTTKLIDENKSNVVILYSAAGKDGYEIKRWHLKEDKTDFRKGAYEARVFIHKKQIIKTRIVTHSLAGDWAHVTEYFYYPGGNLAFTFEGNTTYNGYVYKGEEKQAPDGPFVVEKRSYYSKGGNRIKYLEKAYLKKTGEKVPVDQIQEISPVNYGSVSSLPFFDILRSKYRIVE